MAHSGVVSLNTAMSERNQITITLSYRANKDYRRIAKKLGMPVATLLRQQLEQMHQSPTIGALLRRCDEAYKDEVELLDDE